MGLGRGARPKCGECGPLTPVERDRLTLVLNQVDVVAPMECFDEMLVLLTRVVGAWVSTTYLAENVNSWVEDRDRSFGLAGPLDLRNASDLCGEADPQHPFGNTKSLQI